MTLALDCEECRADIESKHPKWTRDELLENYGDEECRCNKFITCNVCGEQAEFETTISGVHICTKDECLLDVARDNIMADELTDQDHMNYDERHLTEDW